MPGFDSLMLHHTVRTRTRFFMKKGSGTFFVYRRFAFATATNTPVGCLSNRTVCVSRWRGFAPTSSAARVCRAVNEQRQGIAMIVVSCLLFCGIKFALCELGRPPYMARLGVIAAYVRTGRACTPLARCNTLDFVTKVVCHETPARFLWILPAIALPPGFRQ